MAKKHIKAHKEVKPREHRKQSSLHNNTNFWNDKNKKIIFISTAIFATLLIYFQNIFHDFTLNWDDGGYIVVNDVVHKINAENLKIIFSSFDKGNYHPLTTLMYAFEYALVGNNAMLYHINNIIIHLINIFLVYAFIYRISKKHEVAFIVSLFFGIHPMHVESVAWISERKDVMYTMFFFLSILAYHRYAYDKKSSKIIYVLSLTYFFLALMSKSAAVVLPVVLLLVDFYLKRKINVMLFVEKLPFFALSVLFGVLAILSQDSAGAIQDLDPMFSIFERLLLANYALMGYIIKLFAPFNLSAMYPYPERVGNNLPILFYIAPVAVVFITGLTIWLRKKFPFLVFGLLFFLVTIALVIQLLPVGGALMAERYTYVPYIGLFFIIGMFYAYVKEHRNTAINKIKMPFIAVLFLSSGYYALITFDRIKVWENGEILFTDVIKKNPKLPFAYNNRGYFYLRFGEDYLKKQGNKEPKKLALQKAYDDFSTCIKIDPRFDKAFSNRAVLLYNTDRKEEALEDFKKCLAIKPENTDALIGRANTLSDFRRFEEALPDYNLYLKLAPKEFKAYLWRAIAYFNTMQYDNALKDIDTYFSFDKENPEAFFWRGVVNHNLGLHQKAINDLNITITKQPQKAEAYIWRGLAFYSLNEYEKSVSDYTDALKINPNESSAYVNRSTALYKLKKYKEAFQDINTAGQLGHALDKDYFFRLKDLAEKNK